MTADLIMSVDFLAAIITFCYLLKLLFQREYSNVEGFWKGYVEKRSLLNQHVIPRI